MKPKIDHIIICVWKDNGTLKVYDKYAKDNSVHSNAMEWLEKCNW